MKNILVLFACLLIRFSATGQCVPGTMTLPGYSPDSATGLPHAIVGLPYAEVIQVLVPASFQGSTLDSVVLNSVIGLPNGFSFSCTPSNCHLMPLANGCMLLTGPAFPADSAGNVYNLSIQLTAYVHIGSFSIPIPQSVTFYSIIVDMATGMQTLSGSNFAATQNYPNPFSDRTRISFSSSGSETISITVYNLLGAVQYSKAIVSKPGINTATLEAKDFVPGIYMVALTNGKIKITQRMIVVKNQ